MAQPQATGRIFAVDADGRNRRLLFGAEPGSFVFRQMDVISFLPDDPNHILIQHWAHDRTRPMAERLNIDRGRTSGVATSPLNRGALMADQNAQVRFAIGFDDDGKSFFSWRPTVQDEWRNFENNLGTNISPIVFDSSGDYIYVSSREAEHLGLYKLELATGNFERVFVNEHVEIDGSAYKFSADQAELLGVRFMDGTPEWHTIGDDAFEVQWLRQLEAMFEGSVVNISNW